MRESPFRVRIEDPSARGYHLVATTATRGDEEILVVVEIVEWKPEARSTRSAAPAYYAVRDEHGYATAIGQVKLCGKYLGDNDATCPQLSCIRIRGHEGLCDNARGDNAAEARAELERRTVALMRALKEERDANARDHYIGAACCPTCDVVALLAEWEEWEALR